MGCSYCVCKYHFFIQISLKCRETLSVAYPSSKELKHIAIVGCSLLAFIHLYFKCNKFKPNFHGKMAEPAGEIPV
jgi:hypothetical protein